MIKKAEFTYEYVLEELASYVPDAEQMFPPFSWHSREDALFVHRSEDPVSMSSRSGCAGVPMDTLAK